MEDPDKTFQSILELQFGTKPVKADRVLQQKLYAAINSGKVAEVKRLLAEGAHPIAMAPDAFGLPLGNAVTARQPEIAKLLIEAGADPDDGFPHTPLSVAAKMGDVEMTQTLVACGAKLQHVNRNPETPLQLACMADQIDVVKVLLEAGADPNFVAKKERWDTASNYSPLEYAAMSGKREMVKLLSQYSRKSDAENASLALFAAIVSGDLATVKDCIETKNVNPDSTKDAAGLTPLVAAAFHGKANIVKYLLEKGADVNRFAGKKGEKESPLLAAIGSGKLKIVQMLVEAGADLEKPSKQYPEGTPLVYAKGCRLKKITEYLTEALKTSGKSVASSAPVGVTTFDTNESCVLVDAPVAEVSKAFAARVPKSKIKSDAYGKEVKLTDRCYAIFRIKGQPWSIIMTLSCREYKHWPSITDARELSASLKTRALVVANSDTAGVAQYALFDSGKLVEFFDHGSVEQDLDHDQAKMRLEKGYKLDLSGMKLERGALNVFVSSVRELDMKIVKNDLDFINDYVKSQNALIPFYSDVWGAAGETEELVIENLGDDDIERLDYVSA